MDKFRELLEKELNFPCEYTFKFIVPLASKEQIILVLDSNDLSERPSKNGRYVSLTGVKKVQSVEEILSIYKKASTIEGVISL